MRGPRPGKNLRQQPENDLALVLWFLRRVNPAAMVVGLVPYIPGQNPGSLAKAPTTPFT